MDGDRDIIDSLLAGGSQFTWKNFCRPHRDYPGSFGGFDTPEWAVWKGRVLNAITLVCGESAPARALAEVGASIETEGNGKDTFEAVHANLMKALELARSALEDDMFGELRQPAATHKGSSLSNRVFVVHGHDAALKSDVERFLHEIGMQPVVLHRQVDEGATIIEKFEKHADVGYAFILLTPDELAYARDESGGPCGKGEERARPNVIFEFGYFVGRLGRSRVCCIHKGDVAIPSDLNGLVYKAVGESIDSLGYGMIRELKAAGYDLKV